MCEINIICFIDRFICVETIDFSRSFILICQRCVETYETMV